MFIINVYVLVYVGVAVALGAMDNNIYYDKAAWMVGIYVALFMILFIFATTLLINIMSILFGSQNAFMIVYGIEIASIILLGCFRGVKRIEGIYRVAFMLNPISNIVLSWHSSDNATLNSIINILNINMSFNYSLVYLSVLSIVVILVGYFIVNKIDINLDNKEEHA